MQKAYHHSTISRAKYYQISFDVKPFDVSANVLTNLIHLTALNNNSRNPGGRLPSVWFKKGTSSLRITNTVNSALKHVQTTKPLPVNIYSSVLIRFGPGPSNSYNYMIRINGELIHEERLMEGAAKMWENVKVYTGSPYYKPAQAYIRNLKFKKVAGKNFSCTFYANIG